MSFRTIERTFSLFLSRHLDPKRAVLLALSGGPDSLLLFYLLLRNNVSFAVAHVDHGWREESAKEAAKLKELCHKHSVPFHLKTLDPDKMQGSLEEACRNERLSFVRSICQRHQYQAVMLGHHANDRAETTLKRFFEGSSILKLGNMKEISLYEGLPLFRPLLQHTKTHIQQWLHYHEISYFLDSTNESDQFLRGRMRRELIPSLSKVFGKEIVLPLTRISEEAEELEAYFASKLNPFLECVQRGTCGFFLDLSHETSLHPCEWRWLVKEMAAMASISLSYDQVALCVRSLSKNSESRQVVKGNCKIFLDRGRIFFILKDINPMEQKRVIQPGKFCYGNWEVEVKPVEGKRVEESSWRDVLEGRVHCLLPKGNFELGPSHCDRSMQNRWTASGVPVFLRRRIPVIWSGNAIVHEFLSGRSLSRSHPEFMMTMDMKNKEII